MACGNARVENLELNFVKSRTEMVPHVASDVIFEEGGGEAITMNGGVSNEENFKEFSEGIIQIYTSVGCWVCFVLILSFVDGLQERKLLF